MTANQGTRGSGQPAFPFLMLLIACGLEAGLIAPFHLFTRTRGYFENATVFDLVMLVVGALTGILVLVFIRGKTFHLVTVSAVLLTVTAFVTIVQYPAMEYSSQSLSLVEFLGIKSQPMMLNYTIISCLAIILCGGTFDACSRSSSAPPALFFPIGLGLGAAFHFFITILIPSTTGLMMALAIAAIGLIALLGKETPSILSWLRTPPQPSPVSRGRKSILAITGIVSWLIISGICILAMLGFFGTLKQPDDIVKGSLLFSNIIAGAAIAVPIALATRKKLVIGSIIAIAVGGAGLMLLYSFADNGMLFSYPIIVLGIPLVLASWHLVSELFSAGARGITGVFLLISWIAAAYIAFIPIKAPDLAKFSEWIFIAAISAIAVEVVISLLRYFLRRGGIANQ